MTDYIDRHAAINALHNEIVRRRISEDTNDDGALDEFDTEAILRRLPSAQQWIPCSERLPEYGESVLCYFGEDEDFGVNHIIDDEDGEWFIDGVTAWMPLPEPYKTGEVNE